MTEMQTKKHTLSQCAGCFTLDTLCVFVYGEALESRAMYGMIINY
jgi:hypothetical protein